MCEWTIWTDVRLPSFLIWLFTTICRGPGTHDCLSWPTKSRQHEGINVPADFVFPSWDVANPRTTLPISTILDNVMHHGYRNLVYLAWETSASTSARTSMRISSETLSNLFRWLSGFLHVRCTILHNSPWPFWARVLLMSARQDDMSPSGNTFLGKNLSLRLDLWAHTF